MSLALHTFLHVLYHFASSFRSFVYPSHLSPEAYEDSELPTQSRLRDMVTRVKRAQVICLPTIHHILYYYLLILLYLSPLLISRRYFHVAPSIKLLTIPDPDATQLVYYNPFSGALPSSSSGVLPSLLLHLPSFRCDRLNRRSRSIILWKRRVEGDEKKQRDVEWEMRWGEVRWGEVRWGEVRCGEMWWDVVRCGEMWWWEHDENTIDYVRKIYELLVASPSAWDDLGKLLSLSLMYASARSIHLYLQRTTLMSLHIKRVISKSKQDKSIRSLLSALSSSDIC